MSTSHADAFSGGEKMLLLVFGVLIACSLAALVDVSSSYESELRRGTLAFWRCVAPIPVFGPVLWVLYGRPQLVRAPSTPTRNLLVNAATDDNPDFIAYLDRVVAARRHQAQG